MLSSVWQTALTGDCGDRLTTFTCQCPATGYDAAYFAALETLDVGDAHLYLGLIHLTDGIEGSLRRARQLGSITQASV